MVASGHTNAQIARRLGISEGTVRTHLENIYKKLHVSSRTAAVARAFPDRIA
jgi:DNA-binding CsgD family transcriptional regulator